MIQGQPYWYVFLGIRIVTQHQKSIINLVTLDEYINEMLYPSDDFSKKFKKIDQQQFSINKKHQIKIKTIQKKYGVMNFDKRVFDNRIEHCRNYGTLPFGWINSLF